MRRFALVLCLPLLILFAPTTALAQAQTETLHETLDEVFFDVGCEDVVAIHVVGRSVSHVTENDGLHLAVMSAGTFEWTEDGETFRGRFVSRFGENLNRRSSVITFTVAFIGKGNEGIRARFTAVGHLTLNASGDVTTEFEKLRGPSCF